MMAVAMLLASTALLSLLGAARGGSSAEGKTGPPWEWAGTFGLDAARTYTWSAVRGLDGAYVEDELRLAAVRVAVDGRADDARAEAAALWGAEAGWVNVTSGDTLVLGNATGVVLRFDQASWVSLFHLRVAASGRFAVFAQHVPSEFESGFHYLKDESGQDVEPLEVVSALGGATAPPPATGSLEMAVAAAVVTALPGLVMVLVVGPTLHYVSARVFPVLNAFASGAIAAAAVFLLMPEAVHLVMAGSTESQGAAAFGASLLAGWLLCVLVHHICDGLQRHSHGHDHGHCHRQAEGESAGLPEKPTPGIAAASEAAGREDAEAGQEDKDTETTEASREDGTLARVAPVGVVLPTAAPPVDIAVVVAVSFGDFWHNFVDGIVIGLSARSCNPAALWVVAVATLAHEIPQEFADFVIYLVKGHLRWPAAAALNFVSALTSVLGAVLAYKVDMSLLAQGAMLAGGAGVYLFVAFTELVPSLMEVPRPVALSSTLRLLAFALGATCIGVVLVDHKHCEPVVTETPSAGGHAGHAH